MSKGSLTVIALAAVGLSMLANGIVFAQSSLTEGSSVDWKQLVGKEVKVGRLPLCTPHTYSADLSRAGQMATIIDFQPSEIVFSDSMARRLPSNLQKTMEDAAHGGMVTFSFNDGTKLDTCGKLLQSQLTSEIDLKTGGNLPLVKPEQLLSPPNASSATVREASSKPESCPVRISRVASSGSNFGHMLIDQLTTSEFERQVDQVAHEGASKHYLDIKLINSSDKFIDGIELIAVYKNKLGDEISSQTIVPQNTKAVAPGKDVTAFAMDRSEVQQSGIGSVSVYVSRVKFASGELWQDNGSHGCISLGMVK